MENNCMGACEGHKHDDRQLSRKAVLGGLAAVLTGIGLTTFGDAAQAAAKSYKTTLKATSVRVGSAKTVTVKGISILITRPNSTTYRAFKRTCTHQPKTLSSSLVSGTIYCPEHGQQFDANTGAPTGFANQTNRSLTKYSAVAKNGYIYVTV